MLEAEFTPGGARRPACDVPNRRVRIQQSKEAAQIAGWCERCRARREQFLRADQIGIPLEHRFNEQVPPLIPAIDAAFLVWLPHVDSHYGQARHDRGLALDDIELLLDQPSGTSRFGSGSQ